MGTANEWNEYPLVRDPLSEPPAKFCAHVNGPKGPFHMFVDLVVGGSAYPAFCKADVQVPAFPELSARVECTLAKGTLDELMGWILLYWSLSPEGNPNSANAEDPVLEDWEDFDEYDEDDL